MDQSASRIGPNAIIQIGAVLLDRHGPGVVDRVFAAAQLSQYRDAPPVAMVPEREVARLHVALVRTLGAADAEDVAREAGARTARYILAHRIPVPAQRLLRILPPRLASRLLLAAIRRHAWTFAGSASFRAAPGPPVDLALAGCCLCRTHLAGGRLAAFYAATFEGLFRELVSGRARISRPGAGWPGTWTARIDWRMP